MKNERLLNAMGDIHDGLIENALNGKQKQKSKLWLKWGALAACLCLVIGGVFGGMKLFNHPHDANSFNVTLSDDGVTIPTMDISLSSKASVEADMIAFFIYQGRCYVQYDLVYKDADIVGEHLGTATGLINEWTPRDGYIDFAGSVKGDFYAVKGYDPSFMLCMKYATGEVSLYVCNTGITMKYGSELYEERLHLSENYDTVQYEGRDSWYQSENERYQIEGNSDIIYQFLDGLNSAEFVPSDSISLADNSSDVFSKMELYHLYFNMQNGTDVHLRLLKDGYVLYQGILDICVQIPDEVYSQLLTVLENRNEALPVDVPQIVKTVDDCINNPELGKYVPVYMPDEMVVQRSEILYYLDSATAKETGTKELTIEYCDANDLHIYYSITVTWAAEYGQNGWAGSMLDASEISVKTISEYVQTQNSKGEPLSYERIDLGVWYGDVSVVISARGLDAETAYRILNSVNVYQ